MTYTSAFNSICLILGPMVAAYFAFDINRREDGQRTTLFALVINMLAIALKLTILATIALALGTSNDDESDASLAFQWGQITLNTLLSVGLETFALKYVLTRKHLMKYEARKMPKIMAVACGWAMSHLINTQIPRAVTSQVYEDTVRYDLLITSLSSVIDLLRIVGTTLLVEKLTRKGVSQEAKSFIMFSLVAVAFMTEVCVTRIESNENSLDQIGQKSLLSD